MITESTERHQVMLWLKGMSRFPGDFDRAAAINHDELHQDMRWLKGMSRIRGGADFPETLTQRRPSTVTGYLLILDLKITGMQCCKHDA